MTTHEIQTSLTFESSVGTGSNLLQKYLLFVDSQKANSVAWWLGSLLLQGCLLVPLTFLLVYSLDGPTATFLFISMILFFINVVANMGGAAFRTTFNTFVISIAMHVVMVSLTVLNYYYIVF